MKTQNTDPWHLQPTLTGELLLLRPLQATDFADLYTVAAHPLIWEQHPDKTRYQEAGFKRFFQEALESGGALVAIDRASGGIIGSSRFHGYDEEKSEIEIGWTFLARSHWGGRYNREMKQLMLRHAFRFVNNVIFVVDHQNYRSQRAVEKIGGVLVDTKPGSSGREAFVYRITASDFFSSNKEATMYDFSNDLLDAFRSTPAVLEALLAGCTQERAQSARGGDEDWSVVEVVCHLRDAEERALTRMRMMRDEADPFLEAYDQEAWARERNYAKGDLRQCLKSFLQQREQHISELEAIAPEEWERTGRHEEQGRITISAHTLHLVAHDAQHEAQIARQLAITGR